MNYVTHVAVSFWKYLEQAQAKGCFSGVFLD